MSARWLAALAITATTSACVGTRGRVVFDELRYPASLSPYLRPATDPAPPEVLGKFHIDDRAWGILYRQIELSGDVDVSEAINAEVERLGGNGVINLRVTLTQCAIDAVWLLNLIPMWPSCTSIEIDGEVVRSS